MASMIPYRYKSILNRPETNLFRDDFFRSFFGSEPAMNPFRVDVRDKGDHYLLEAELPGMSREQVHVDVDDGVLTISADINEHSEEEKKEYVFSERRWGHMQRSFTLNQVNEEGIRAEYVDGILKLTLPKLVEPEKTVRKIDIQ